MFYFSLVAVKTLQQEKWLKATWLSLPQRGCPCRDEGLHCTEQCKCGTKKARCKNKDPAGNGGAGPANENAGQNAFECHKIAVYEAKQQITVGSQLDLHNNLPFLTILACVSAGHVYVLKHKYTFNSVSKRQHVRLRRRLYYYFVYYIILMRYLVHIYIDLKPYT